MYLIVGLGNPGIEYKRTRHNMGFQTIEKLACKYNIALNKSKFNGTYGETILNGEKVIFLQPQTFMNLSGKSIIQFIQYYKIELEKILVIYDDMDVMPGKIKIRKKGSAGSHNGMKSIIEELKDENFARIRVGIGKPQTKGDNINYVLGYIEENEYRVLQEGIEIATEGVKDYLEHGIDHAMNEFNKKG